MASVSLVDFDHAVEYVHLQLKQLFMFSPVSSFQSNQIWSLKTINGNLMVEVDLESGAIVTTLVD